MTKSPIKLKRDKKGHFIKASVSGFPQIFRDIPASGAFLRLQRWINWRTLIVLAISSLVLLQIVQYGQILYDSYIQSTLKQREKQTLEEQIAKWEEVVTKRPDYRDGYLQLALLNYRLDRIYATRFYLKKVFTLDPNFEPARELEKKLRY